MTREQLQQLPTVDDLLQLRMALCTEIDLLKKTIGQLRDEMASSGAVKPNRTFLTPKEFGGKVGVSERTVINWIMSGVLRGSQPHGAKTAWIIPASELDRMETEALDEKLTVKQFMRRL
jgi:hypothetical protein